MSSCKGTGKITAKACETCIGSASVTRTIIEEFEIPKGVRDFDQMRLPEKGGYGIRGGKRGDIIIVLVLDYPNVNDLTAEEVELFKRICEKQKNTTS